MEPHLPTDARDRRLAAVDAAGAPSGNLIGEPLTVVFAEGAAIEGARRGETDAIPLEPPFHLSDEDAYLVLPDDIGVEIVDILRDGDGELLAEALRDGLVVRGAVDRGPDGMELVVRQVATPAALVENGGPWQATVPAGPGEEPLFDLAVLPHLQCTVVSSLFDEAGLDRARASAEDADEGSMGFIGTSWGEPAGGADAEASFAWVRRQDDGSLGVELALFVEYDEMVALIRPVRLTLS